MSLKFKVDHMETRIDPSSGKLFLMSVTLIQLDDMLRPLIHY